MALGVTIALAVGVIEGTKVGVVVGDGLALGWLEGTRTGGDTMVADEEFGAGVLAVVSVNDDEVFK